MKEKSVMLVLLAALVLMVSGQGEGLHGSTHDHPTEASMPAHQGSTHVGPAVFKPEFENESVQVVRITLGPHAKLPMHDQSARVFVLLTDQDLRLTFLNRETRVEHHKAGETMWLSAQRHAGENLNDKRIEFIAVIPKHK